MNITEFQKKYLPNKSVKILTCDEVEMLELYRKNKPYYRKKMKGV